MEIKKETRGRKPLKDKKVCIRFYIRQSKIKKAGGEKALTKSVYEYIDANFILNTNY